MSTKDDVHGEGNYEASRKYNQATKKFVESGRVEEAAQEAAPRTPAEAAEMKMAEKAALLKARGEAKKPPIVEPDEKPRPIDDPERQPVEPDKKTAGPPPLPGRGPDRG